MLIDRAQLSFFGKREVNALYDTLALTNFGEGLVSIFVPIFLWKNGVVIWQILYFYFLSSAYFVGLTFLILPFLKKMSDKMMMFLSAPFLIFYLFGLYYISAAPILFYILPLALALNTLFFDVGYNLDFSQSVDGEKIGRELGARNTISALVNFSAPFFGGSLIVLFGFKITFLIASLILLGAVVPLFFFPHRHLVSDLKSSQIIKFLTGRGIQSFNLSGIAYSMMLTIDGLLWPFFIFFAISSTRSLGGVVSVGLFASAITTYFIGFLSDAGDRRKIITITTVLFSIVWLFRIMFSSPGMIMALSVAGGIISAGLLVAWTSQFYKITRAVQHPSPFILSREVLYQLARVIFLPILMLCAYAFSTTHFFYASFGIAALLQLLFLFANKFHLNDLTAMDE